MAVSLVGGNLNRPDAPFPSIWRNSMRSTGSGGRALSRLKLEFSEVNGTDYDGRPVTVNEAKPMNRRDGGSRASAR